MRLEEYQLLQAKQGRRVPVKGGKADLPSQRELSSCESFVSLDEPPKDYEVMLQKYEAEVRNHIKIEQQLKLHIECLQDKLEDAEKLIATPDVDAAKDSRRYKELLEIREKEVDILQKDLIRMQD